MIESCISEFHRYRSIGSEALAQVSDDTLNHVPLPDGNSMAMLVRHISGNLKSRFTDFLTDDGEKPWRHRDAEFEERRYTRDQVQAMWTEGWNTLERALADLSDNDMERKILIRGTELTIDAALARSLAHVAYRVGQITLLGRMGRGESWQWISIPKGKPAENNLNLTKEKPS